MEKTREKPRAIREPLSRQRILEAAVKLVDAEGLSALTMRRLAADLGVEGASLYKHIPNKAALLYGMMETIFREMNPDYPADPADWQGRLRAGMRSFRQLGVSHPQVFVLLNRPWEANTIRVESELSAMMDHGLTTKQAAYAFRLLASFVVGFVTWEMSSLVRDPEELAETEHESSLHRSPELYPHTLAARPYMNGPGMDEAFEFGLSAAIAGIEVIVAGEGN
jgi:AcrR family transcriptional regulator